MRWASYGIDVAEQHLLLSVPQIVCGKDKDCDQSGMERENSQCRGIA